MDFLADTNILVRLFTQDDKEQFEKFSEMLDSGDIQMMVSSPVIIETCWVLKSHYKHPNVDVGNALLNLSQIDNIIFEEDYMKDALRLFVEKGNVDIVDCYLSAKSKTINMPVVTWDGDFKKLGCEYYKPDQF
ncbi:Predicted nucleic-acid-binding protein, contains PIN domain [Paenibacillus sp. CF095]|uniref:PIN domain-containing protein n=1 Tax=Paenibacillus sp. CF095 TaxID=1881033 RepID=UPI00087E2172|nr:PIN domain-containing protein [Paenibacillus sp. CF095]SDD49843.1 Predicted nucleic-acid-binding protein, contains PIN domain [Paenibacillus sp. CF095]